MSLTTNRAMLDLEAWASKGAKPLRPLPASVFTSEAQLQLEIEQVFEKEWVCVGHASQLREPGDYLTFDIVGKPVLVVRDTAAKLRAFSNVCRHRGAELAAGSGRRRSFSCPYHAWIYDLDGRLRGAPHMEESDLEGICLPEYQLENWHGLLFVNLDPAAEPLAPRIEDLAERFSVYRLDGYRIAHQMAGEMDCNWKVLIENFCESYHLFQVHKTTLEPDSPTRTHVMQPGGEGFNHHLGHFVTSRPYEGAPDYVPTEAKETYHISCIYPCVAMNVDSKSLFWITVQPMGVARCRYDLWYTIPTDVDMPKDPEAEIGAFVAEFMAEDKAVIERVQRGIAADSGHNGPLHEWERGNWEFGHYLARTLGVGRREIDQAL